MTDWPDRFERFVFRKEREASNATLSRFTTDMDDGSSLLPIGDDWSLALFDLPAEPIFGSPWRRAPRT